MKLAVLYAKKMGIQFSAPAVIELDKYIRVALGTFEGDETSALAAVFQSFQGEFMLPKHLKVLRDLTSHGETDHTSMSVGDMVHDLDNHVFYYCDSIGWKKYGTEGEWQLTVQKVVPIQ